MPLASHGYQGYNPTVMINDEIEDAYQKTLDYLYSFVDYSLQKNFRNAPEKFNLGRMYAFMEALGNPHRRYPVLHVAGTKGKGSVTALCASALQAAGYRVGFYISPHLSDYNERIQVNLTPIPHAELVSLVEKTKTVIASIPELTTFEITTGLAFLYFAEKKIDVAVIEVGLGGRLDATNVVTPLVSVITSLSYDHMHLLGDTLVEIATEKAGIIKSGAPVVLSLQKEEASQVVTRIAAKRGSPVVQLGQDYRYTPVSHSLDSQTLLVWGMADQDKMNAYLETGNLNDWEPTRLEIPLLGYHQVENAATAYAALQTARARGLNISENQIQTGFRQVVWPGRFEILRREPPVVVDSAHNRDSAMKLRIALVDYFPGYPVVLIIGASEDKDLFGIFAELTPTVRQVFATKAVHPRATDPHVLVELAHQFGRPALAVPDVSEALKEALLQAGDQALVLVAGSIFVAAAARDAWKARVTHLHG
jgi:dihydrofolate synthase/folylpolyglutamate synthase